MLQFQFNGRILNFIGLGLEQKVSTRIPGHHIQRLQRLPCGVFLLPERPQPSQSERVSESEWRAWFTRLVKGPEPNQRLA